VSVTGERMSEVVTDGEGRRSARTVPYPLPSLLSYRVTLVAFGLFVIFAWMPRVTTMGDSDIGIGALLLAIMATMTLFAPKHARLDRQSEGYRLAIFAGVGFLLFWGYLGIFGLDDPFRAGRLLLSAGQGVVLVFVISQVLSVRALRISVALACVTLVGTCLLSLYNYLGGAPTSLTILIPGHDRASGLFKNPNQFGMTVVMGVPFAVALYFRRGFRVLSVLLTCTIFIGLLMAASKTNLTLGVLLLLATMSYLLASHGRLQTLLVVLPLASVTILFGGVPLLELVNPRAAEIITELAVGGNIGENATVAQRIDMWSHSLEEARRSPMFGQGTGQKIDTTAQVHSHSHNMFVDLVRTTGIPGVIGALVFVLASCSLAVHTLLRLTRLPAQVACELPGYPIVVGSSFAVFSYVVSNQMSDSFGPSTSVFFWLCVGLLLRRDDLLFGGASGASAVPCRRRERAPDARVRDRSSSPPAATRGRTRS